MKRFLLMVLACIAIAGAAIAQDEGGISLAKKGIVFGFSSVLTPTTLNDAYQAGIGVKGWLDEQNAIRGLIHLQFAPEQGATPSQTDFGLGAAWERHFGPGPVTPYMGAFLGTSIVVQGGSNVDLYLGGVFGGEMPVKDNLNLFGEYDVRVLVDDVGFWLDNIANFGFILYFD